MRTRYMLQASAIAVGQVALLGSIAIGQIVRFERSGAAGHTPDFLDTFVEVLSWPVFLVVRPQSTFWLRPYLARRRSIYPPHAAGGPLCGPRLMRDVRPAW